MKVLVTGGGGFLGFHIVQQLVERGDEVIVLGRNHYPKVDHIGATSIVADICDRPKIEKHFEDVEEVYHVAAMAGIWGDWNDFYQINFIGTKNVLECCQASSVRRFIYTSSPSVVFDGTSQKNLDESTNYPTSWLAHYPHTKMLAEKLVLASNCDKLKTVALRPHLIWGPGDQHLFPRLVQRAKSGQLAIVGEGSNRVDVIYVVNAAKGHLQAAEALLKTGAPAGKAYFLGQDVPVDLWDFIGKVLDREKAPAVRRKVSFKAAYLAGATFEIIYKLFRIKSEPRMTRFVACQLACDHYYDHSNAIKDFKYNPSITTEEGLDQMYSSH